MPPQSHHSPQSTPRKALPSTPTKAFLAQLATPQTGEVRKSPKRTYRHMSTGSQPPKTPSSQRTEAEREKIRANIEAALNEASDEEENTTAQGVQTDPERTSQTIVDFNGHSERASSTPHRSVIDSDTEEDENRPSKRQHTSVKGEGYGSNQRTVTPPKSIYSTISDQLPTPSSPTSYTRGGQRALSRASMNSSVDSTILGSKDKQRDPSKTRSVASSTSGSTPRSLVTAREAADAASIVAQQQQHPMDAAEDRQGSSVRFPFLRSLCSFLIASVSVPVQTEHDSQPNGTLADTNIANKPSFERQLADVFLSRSARQSSVASPEPGSYASLYTQAVKAMEKSNQSMTDLNSIFQGMGQRERALQRDVKSLQEKFRVNEGRIKELERENMS